MTASLLVEYDRIKQTIIELLLDCTDELTLFEVQSSLLTLETAAGETIYLKGHLVTVLELFTI